MFESRFIYTLPLCLVFLNSCVHGFLVQKLSKFPVSIENITSQQKSIHKKKYNVQLTIKKSIAQESKFSPKKEFFFTLLIFHYNTGITNISLGQDLIGQDFQTYLKNSITAKCNSGANFSVSDSISNSKLRLELTIDSCSIISNYKRTTTTFSPIVSIFIRNINEYPYGTKINMAVTTKLYKANTLISTQHYKQNDIFPFEDFEDNLELLKYKFMSSMTKALSLSTEKIIDKIIASTNSELKN